MGHQHSLPQKGAELQVIGAGLPRTGTLSLAKALEILLHGPVHHGGTQLTAGREADIKSWIKLFSQPPPLTPDEPTLKLIKEQVAGYVGITDVPGCVLVPFLLRLYPQAKVVVTTRDVDSWERSMAAVSGQATRRLLGLIVFLLPTIRLFPRFVAVGRKHWLHTYGEIEPPTRKSYEAHERMLRELVPRDRLFFIEVWDGWEPLCEALGVPVPEVPFPHVNDGKATEAFAKRQIVKGLLSWVALLTMIWAVGYLWRS